MPLTSIFRMFGVIAFAAALHSGATAQGLVTQKNIPLAMAKTIAEAAMEKCNALGFRVSVVVVDRAGLPLVMLRGDGAGLHTPEGADRKAYTARTFGTSSAQFVQRMLNDPASPGSKLRTFPSSAGINSVGCSLHRGRVMSISPTHRMP